MAEIKSLLDELIESEIDNLDSLSFDDGEKEQAIKDLVRLHQLRIEEIKTEAEVAEKRERLEMDSKKQEADQIREETALKQQAKENRIDRVVKVVVAGVELVVPLLFYGIWMNKGFRFEETGSFTSTTFKNLLSRFRPTK